VTASTALVATAASTADPPAASAATPASVASRSALATMAVGAWVVVNGASVEAIAGHRRGGSRRTASALPPLAAGVAVLGVVLVVVGSLLPWVRTGRRRRSSYDLIGLADRLGVLPAGAAGVLARAWVLAPLLAGATVAAVALHRRTVAGVLAVVTGLYAVVLGALVWTSPLATEAGVAVSVSGGIVAGLGGGALIVLGRSDGVEGNNHHE
jgi:hypothetical protein